MEVRGKWYDPSKNLRRGLPRTGGRNGLGSGCSQGITGGHPGWGLANIPIPLSPYFQDRKEDEFWMHERYNRVPILGPVTAGGPPRAA